MVHSAVRLQPPPVLLLCGVQAHQVVEDSCHSLPGTGSIPADWKEEKKTCFPLRIFLRGCTQHLSLNPIGQNFIFGLGRLLGKLENVVSILHDPLNIQGCIIKEEEAIGGRCHSIYQSYCEDEGDNM